jgi:hypothetical protein
VDLASFVPDYSGVAVLDFHEVPFPASGHLNTDQFLIFHTILSKWMSTLICDADYHMSGYSKKTGLLRKFKACLREAASAKAGRNL